MADNHTAESDYIEACLLAMFEIAERDIGGKDGRLSEQAKAAIAKIAAMAQSKDESEQP